MELANRMEVAGCQSSMELALESMRMLGRLGMGLSTMHEVWKVSHR